jgi:serine/threonine protein kinase
VEAEIPGPGTLLGERYRLDELIGEGAFSQVFRASDLQSNEDVALKLLGAGSVEVAGLERFRREAELARKLVHPNSVRLLDFDLESTPAFIVYELLEGQTLESLLAKEGPMSEAGVVVIASQVLMSVREAHSIGAVHRDIKPANIFICRGVGLVKVLDFGIARTTGNAEAPLTAAGLLIGTPRYMPPEQIRGSEPIPAMDVYAVGMMMAEMLTGEPVLRCTAVEACLAQLEPARIPLPERVERSGLAAVIRRATEKDLDVRYANAAEMLAGLRRVGPTASSEAPAPLESEKARNRDSMSPTEVMPNPELVLGELLFNQPALAAPAAPLAPARPPAPLPPSAPPPATARAGGSAKWLGATVLLLLLAILLTAFFVYAVRTAP